VKGLSQGKATRTRHKCKNCGTVYDGNFCPQCGQGAAEKRLGWKAVGVDILGGFMNISSGFLHTLIRLFYYPGRMIRDFIRGKRANYFRPFQLLFVLAAIYAIGFQIKYGTLEETKVQQQEALQEALKQKKASNEEVAAIDSLLKANGHLGEDADKVFNNKFLDTMYGSIKKAVSSNKALRALVYLPFFTLGTFWAFGESRKKRRLNFTETLYAQCYVSCQALCVAVLLLPFTSARNAVYPLLNAGLGVWAFKDLFEYDWWKTIWKFILSYIYAFLMMLALIAVVVLIALGVAAVASI
jgi:hypothetical protein